MSARKVKPVDTAAPPQQPLHEYAPTIFDVARFAHTDIDNLRALAEAIVMIAEFENQEERPFLARRLMLVGKLAQIAKELADDRHNTVDVQIAACMLASDDPAIRAEARP